MKKLIILLIIVWGKFGYSQNYIDTTIGLTSNESSFSEIKVGTKIDTPVSISVGTIIMWDYKSMNGDRTVNPKFSVTSHLNNEMRVTAGIQTELYRPSEINTVNIFNTNVKFLPSFSLNIPLYRRYPIGYGRKYIEYTPEIFVGYDTKNILIGLNLNINNL